MKVVKSRKDKTSIMAHGHFGDLKITRGDISVVIPQKDLTSCGNIRKGTNVDKLFENAKKEKAFNFKEVC